VAIIFPISVDEPSLKFQISITKETFEYIQYLFFVYPDTMISKDLNELRNTHLLEFNGRLEFTLRELDVFCNGVMKWKKEIDAWQGDTLENPFSGVYNQELHSSLENDVSSIFKIIKPQLISDASYRNRIEK